MTGSGKACHAQLTLKEKIATFLLPNIGDIVFLLLLQIPLSFLPSFVFGDGSTGWHLVTGDYILQTHQIPRVDLISYTHANDAWVAYEWLADVIMASLVKIGGLNLLAVCVASSVGWLIILLYQRCRKEGAHFSLAVFLATAGVIVMAIHWMARPHIFVWFGVYLFSTKLEDFYRGEIGRWQLLIPLTLYMVLWVNVHPLFLLGFILLAIYLTSALTATIFFIKTDKQSRYLDKARWLAVTAASCGAATLLNPYGFGLFSYILHYLHGNPVINETGEFLSPVFHGMLQPSCLEILFALLIFGLAFSARRVSLPSLLTCIAFGHLTLSGVRNMPLFVIISLPVISALWSRFSVYSEQTPANWTWIRERWTKMSVLFDENEALCNKHLWPAACFIFLACAAINGGSLFGSKILDCGWSPNNKPTVTLEYLREAEKRGQLEANKGFNFDNWGGYLRYRLGTRVFIDDRSDFYGDKFYYLYAIVSLVEPGWEKVLDDNKIQWIIMPKDSRLAAALSDSSLWHKLSQDQASMLFARR